MCIAICGQLTYVSVVGGSSLMHLCGSDGGARRRNHDGGLLARLCAAAASSSLEPVHDRGTIASLAPWQLATTTIREPARLHGYSCMCLCDCSCMCARLYLYLATGQPGTARCLTAEGARRALRGKGHALPVCVPGLRPRHGPVGLFAYRARPSGTTKIEGRANP